MHVEDLLSGLGGAMGLWLGWSALSLGYFIIQAFKTLDSVNDIVIKGLEDFSANPVTLRGNILRMR